MPRKPATTAAAPAFDLSLFREAKHYVWREIEREEQEPLRVKLQDLSIRQTNAIPWATGMALRTVFEHIAPYVVAWDFEAVNIETGETVAVPPPAEAGPDVFELLPNTVGTEIVMWLRTPWVMTVNAKKALKPSTSTTDPPKTSD